MEYTQFLKQKQIINTSKGIDIDRNLLNPMLFEFQRDIVWWALKKGKACIFADCGLGKTPMQLEWANQVHKHTSGDVLILAPLAVSKQTKREGDKFGIKVNICNSQDDVKPGINITNYEKLKHFNPDAFAGIVLDESSILKSFTGKIRTQIIEAFNKTPYRLACTATPAPNDYMELGNHAEFCGVMTRAEMLATFFIHDGGDTSKWRLKGHAEDKFWEWVASWAVVIRKPSDLGYDDGKFILPQCNVHTRIIKMDNEDCFTLIPLPAKTLQERRQARKDSMKKRVAEVAEMVNQSKEQWLVWCDYNDESEALAKAIPGAVEVKGSDTAEHKENAMLGFAEGTIRVLVTKPSIAGFGMNWQNCSNMAFCGLSDSYEQFYQAVRRCWRFGQEKEVDVHVVIGETEILVLENVKRKEMEALKMAEGMVEHMKDFTKKEIHSTEREVAEYKEDVAKGEMWTLYLGDCVEKIKEIKDDSIHYTIFSPPFASLYTYSNSERDMGNCRTDEEFMTHFSFLVSELYRVTMPGRLVSFHCMDIPAMKERDGYIGLKDFPGDLIRIFQSAGFIYHSKVVIWKDPLIEATRTKALGLMHKQLVKDSSICRQGLPDYLITMRKPGDNPEPIAHPDGLTSFVGENEPDIPKNKIEYSHHVWRRYASPVWMDINQTNTLQKESARENKDERHICPLQLDVIERALTLWSNPGDIILSPFAGIGSEGYVAVKMDRRFVGIELKESYWKCSINNLKMAELEKKQGTLFEFLEKKGVNNNA